MAVSPSPAGDTDEHVQPREAREARAFPPARLLREGHEARLGVRRRTGIRALRGPQRREDGRRTGPGRGASRRLGGSGSPSHRRAGLGHGRPRGALASRGWKSEARRGTALRAGARPVADHARARRADGAVGRDHRSLHDAAEELARYLREVRAVSEPLGIRWLACGTHPTARSTRSPGYPSTATTSCAQYLPTRGRRAHQMMKGTCGDAGEPRLRRRGRRDGQAARGDGDHLDRRRHVRRTRPSRPACPTGA